MKYIHLIDKLLKVPMWAQLIAPVITAIFVDVFLSLLRQKCFNELE